MLLLGFGKPPDFGRGKGQNGNTFAVKTAVPHQSPAACPACYLLRAITSSTQSS